MFWRVHWLDCPQFSAENATSAPWGTAASADECSWCDENGEIYDEATDEYVACPYHGAQARTDGYSCCESPEQLVSYFGHRAGCPDDMPVVVFAGRIVDHGPDLESLVIPRLKPRPRWLRYGDIERAITGRQH